MGTATHSVHTYRQIRPIDIPPSRTERQALERERKKMMKWIERNCKNLLCPVGTPAKLEHFVIDTGDTEPIKIGPRPYSPVNLQKIKQFIDENLQNGIIRESDSPWSALSCLRLKQMEPHEFVSTVAR